MPFPKWAVEPVFLCRKPLPPDKNACELYSVTNVQLVNCLRQLSSVAKIADNIFEEIGSECRLLAERAHRLKEKVCIVQEVVDNLNARAVKVPVSDLSQTARILRHQKPYQTSYEKSTQLFLPSTRPPCIDLLYGSACTTPVAVMCTIDKYRTDGLSSSELFMVTPVLGGERKRKQKRYLDIETRKPANFTLANIKQDAVQSGSSSLPPLVSPSAGFILKQNENLELERLPSPEEQAMLVSLQYPSTVVPVDTSGASFNKMSLLRRSLIHADFVIKRKKSKKKSKRRHTFCEGQNKEIEQAIRNVTNSSCQTDDMLDTTISSTASIHRSLSRRRSRSAVDNSRRKTLLDELDLDSLQQESKDSATEDDKEKSPSKASTIIVKKSKTTLSLRSKSFNPISSLSAAISVAAVKMRNSTRGAGSKQDDGRSSSGNWSASSSTRASVDSDHQHAISPVDGVSSPSRNSVGKDSVLSDATQIDPHNRSRDEILLIQSLSSSPIKRKKFGALNLPWEPNHGNGRISKTPTPDFTSHCSSSTPVIRSPYAGRRGISDDGDSSVYSVDTDGYYTSMHTDSGLWCNALNNKLDEEMIPETAGFRERQESQSSVSTIDNSSINSFLSKSATECSSNSGSLKRKAGPDPPPRVSSNVNNKKTDKIEALNKDQDAEGSDKSYSPHPQNGSTSESEHEVRDRIRVKTTITANRYPSMCAVSPETSDDEVAELKNKTLSNINVIVAEVHREDKSYDDKSSYDNTNSINKPIDVPVNVPKINQSSINMYRSETPIPSNFSSVTQSNQPVATSTPRSGINITTFSPDLNESRNKKSGSSNLKLSDLGENCDSDDEITVTGSPSVSQSQFDKSLIPLKYAQRITVTPIARSDSSSSNTGTIKRTPLKTHNSASNTFNSPGTEKPLTVSHSKKDSQSSYISFQAPDSPVSSVPSFNKISSNEKVPNSPNSSLHRPVARVTLDPSGKVVYSSNSLGRTYNSNPNKYTLERSYATLPLCQTYTDSKPITPMQNTPSFSNARVSVQENIKKDSNPNQTTVFKPLEPMPYSSFKGGVKVSALADDKLCNNQIPVSKPMATMTYSSSSKSDSRTSVPVNNREISSDQLIVSKPLTSMAHSSFKGDIRLAVPGNERENSNNNQIRVSKPVPPITHLSSFAQSENISSPKLNTERHDFSFRPSRGGRFCRSYFPSHLISPPPASQSEEKQFVKGIYSPGVSEQGKVFINSPAKPLTENPAWQNHSVPSSQVTEPCNRYSASTRHPSFYPPSAVPNTVNDSTLYSPCSAKIWPGRLYNLQNNNCTSVRLKQPVASNMTNICSDIKKSTTPASFVSLRPPDLIPSGESPPSTLDITSPAGSHRSLNQENVVKANESEKDSVTENGQNNLKSLSATELFAIIHSSKKKHNIKSDSEISMSPMSSRSVSPALSQTSLSKLQPVETGVLTKRNDTTLNSPDRTKWCNSMPSNFRKQMPHDKVGSTKPTSMHDFKMLLLQTRTGSNDSNPRPSAAELLKVSPTRHSPVPYSNSSKSPVPSMFKSPISHYSSNPTYSPGHGTVPVKRNMRTRSPYLTRYDSAYPPIMEDCSEEIESSYGDSKCLNQSQIYRMPDAVPRPTPVAKATSTWV